MKYTILTLLIVFFTGCSKDSSNNFVAKLPAETQVGANTFGVTINGKVYVPRTPTGGGVGDHPHAVIWWAAPGGTNEYNELEIKDGASAVGFNMIIHLQGFNAIGVAQYILHESNFHSDIDSTPFTHIYFKIWDNSISNYAYYGSVENQGVVNISRHSNGIISGNFNGTFVRYDNPNDFIHISDGRFDIGPNLYSASFP